MAAQTRRLIGPNAAVRKYDVLTAIAIASLRRDALTPTQGLRLVALITAHYDWSRDEVAVGQDALMRLWGVSKRTVIRDLAAFRALGLLRLVAAGRRGRVAVHRLGHDAVAALSADAWDCAGAAFARRMIPGAAAAEDPDSPDPSGAPVDPSEDPALWTAIRARLAETLEPAAAARWLAPLRLRGAVGPRLLLSAPTRFHAAYVEREYGDRIAAAAAQVLGRTVRLGIDADGRR